MPIDNELIMKIMVRNCWRKRENIWTLHSSFLLLLHIIIKPSPKVPLCGQNVANRNSTEIGGFWVTGDTQCLWVLPINRLSVKSCWVCLFCLYPISSYTRLWLSLVFTLTLFLIVSVHSLQMRNLPKEPQLVNKKAPFSPICEFTILWDLKGVFFGDM